MKKTSEKAKMMMFVNQPMFTENFIRNKGSQFFSREILKNIYPSLARIERFKNLEQTRNLVTEDQDIDEIMVDFVTRVQQKLQKVNISNEEINERKKQIIKKFRVDIVNEELKKNLKVLEKQINYYEQLQMKVNEDKKQIQNMLQITRIRNVLKVQNKMLRQQRRRLEKQQAELDIRLLEA